MAQGLVISKDGNGLSAGNIDPPQTWDRDDVLPAGVDEAVVIWRPVGLGAILV
jgi:hypothetical protein